MDKKMFFILEASLFRKSSFQNSILSCRESINQLAQPIWPEFSEMFGSEDYTSHKIEEVDIYDLDSFHLMWDLNGASIEFGGIGF